MKKLLLPLFLIGISLITNVFGYADLENRELIAESSDLENFLILEFGEYDFTRKGKPIPNLEFGFLSMGDLGMELTKSHTKIMGNSFVIKNNDVLIYAKGEGGNKYHLNLYLINDGYFTKIQFDTTDSGIIQKNIQQKITPTPQIEKQEYPKINLIILGDTSYQVPVKDAYRFTIRVFDEQLNPLRDVNKRDGYIIGANVNIQITNSEGSEIWSDRGQTSNTGYYEGFLVFPSDNRLIGEYAAKYTVEYQGNTVIYYDTFFVLEYNADRTMKPIA